MDLSANLKKYKIDENKLVPYGFNYDGKQYTYKKDLSNEEFYSLFTYKNNTLNVSIYDKAFDDLYLPFEVKNSKNTIVSALNLEIESIMDDIFLKCSLVCKIKEDILNYCKEKYNSIMDNPFELEYVNGVLRIDQSKKWYALFINIPYKTLKINHEGRMDIITLKFDPNEITSISLIFNSFPLNKTVLLDPHFGQILAYFKVSYSVLQSLQIVTAFIIIILSLHPLVTSRFSTAHFQISSKYDGTIVETSPISKVTLLTSFTLFSLAVFWIVSNISKTIIISCIN